MYLHGDGGSHIYFTDGLQKTITIDKSDARELQVETNDLKRNLKTESFDVVLTNPPFSMWYEQTNEAQESILKEYELIKSLNTKEKLEKFKKDYLSKILLHAYKNVKYYHDLFDGINIIKNNNVDLNKFTEIQILTKEYFYQ